MLRTTESGGTRPTEDDRQCHLSLSALSALLPAPKLRFSITLSLAISYHEKPDDFQSTIWTHTTPIGNPPGDQGRLRAEAAPLTRTALAVRVNQEVAWAWRDSKSNNLFQAMPCLPSSVTYMVGSSETQKRQRRFPAPKGDRSLFPACLHLSKLQSYPGLGRAKRLIHVCAPKVNEKSICSIPSTAFSRRYLRAT